MDANELVPQEIWTVSIRTPAGCQIVYVLAATCEVVGCSALLEVNDFPIRADWTAYIRSRKLQSSVNSDSLMSYIRWTNHEEYERGISRLWQRRIAAEGDTSLVKLEVAERYVLACVVANRSAAFNSSVV